MLVRRYKNGSRAYKNVGITFNDSHLIEIELEKRLPFS